MTERTVWRIHSSLILAYAAGAAALWPQLPARLPLHFDFGGRVTAWTDTALWNWFGLPAVAVGLVFMLRGLVSLATSTPETWSVPEKERFLALDPTARAPIVRRLRTEGALISLVMTAVLIALHIGMYQTAVTNATRMPWYASATAGALLVGVLLHCLHAARKLRTHILAAGELPAAGHDT